LLSKILTGDDARTDDEANIHKSSLAIYKERKSFGKKCEAIKIPEQQESKV